MKLSTRGQYGVRLLLDVVLHQGKKPVPLRDIARRQQIPLPYLKRLVTPLITGGLLRSSRGVGGGVSLAKPPASIRLREIIDLLEGPIALVECIVDPGVCDRSGFCATQDIWSAMGKAMNKVLNATTLKDLAELQKTKNQPETAMYYI